MQESFGSSEIHSRSRGSSNLVLGKLRLPEEQYLAGKKGMGYFFLSPPMQVPNVVWMALFPEPPPHPPNTWKGRQVHGGYSPGEGGKMPGW